MGTKLTPQELSLRDGIGHVAYSVEHINTLVHFGCDDGALFHQQAEMLRMTLVMMMASEKNEIRVEFPGSNMATVGVQGESGALGAVLVERNHSVNKGLRRSLRMLVGDPRTKTDA